MHCPACGKALARRTKYCTHCGEQLRQEETAAIEKLEKRFDDYVDGVFWITVFGLGLILGGMVVMKEVLHLNQGLIVAYMALSSLAFLTVFGICLKEVLALAKRKNKAQADAEEEPFDTNELVATKEPRRLGEAMSIVDDTTRPLETRPKESVPS